MEYEVSATFYLLLTNLLIAQSKTRGTSEITEKIVSYIQANYMRIKTTELSIDEISRQTGFSDSVYFIQVFKKIEGITPSKFRRT